MSDNLSASRNRRGQALSEYLILTALIAVASIGVVQVLGSNLHRSLAEVAAALGGEKKELAAQKIEEKHYEVRDLGDFQEGLRDNSEREGGK